MKYGMPYKGSKSRFARAIIDALPEGETLVDLFGGGSYIPLCSCLREVAEGGL